MGRQYNTIQKCSVNRCIHAYIHIHTFIYIDVYVLIQHPDSVCIHMTWFSTGAHPVSTAAEELSDEILRRYDLHPPGSEKAGNDSEDLLKVHGDLLTGR